MCVSVLMCVRERERERERKRNKGGYSREWRKGKAEVFCISGRIKEVNTRRERERERERGREGGRRRRRRAERGGDEKASTYTNAMDNDEVTERNLPRKDKKR
ncbi:hypothetical protein BP00DRAFT_117051 [Aspergillus indologenus CBS 114.80]|uniref:Uncharacterized protein n=1 Tax=Aspergillus indologenus CBS 114.80 TaxID=1450541 RepID=A0A2V5HL51_9EURO|nr:hypothetical protein BP00DRAFT_117051 [Aspergillus indologenus CBS 114.80]